MAASDLAIAGTVLVEGRLAAAAWWTSPTAASSPSTPPAPGSTPRERVTLADDEVLLPGLVDTHVHVNEPGRTEWEGFATATRAAAAGGVTTLVDMPLNSIPPTVDPAALEVKRRAAAGPVPRGRRLLGRRRPGERSATSPPCTTPGCFGFKCFLVDSGVPEFPPLSPAELDRALAEVAGLDALLIVHAEDAETLAHAPGCAGASYADFVGSRPPEAEDRRDRAACSSGPRGTAPGCTCCTCPAPTRCPCSRRPGRTGSRDRRDLPALPDAERRGGPGRAHGVQVLPADPGAPPTGTRCGGAGRRHHRLRRLRPLAPPPPDLKWLDTGDFGEAWGGIASLQLGLPLVWTEARERGVALETVVGWMSAAPAALAGLAAKGAIAPGRDADLVVFAPDESFVVDPARLHHRHPVTPYAGRELHRRRPRRLAARRSAW